MLKKPIFWVIIVLVVIVIAYIFVKRDSNVESVVNKAKQEVAKVTDSKANAPAAVVHGDTAKPADTTATTTPAATTAPATSAAAPATAPATPAAPATTPAS